MLGVRERVAAEKERRYEAYEFERMRTDEITDASERIALPMDNSFEYEIGDDGHLYYQDQSIGSILDEGVSRARVVAETNPAFTREYIHRQIERQEYDEQRRLALSSAAQDILVVISPQVKEIGKRLTMVRIYERTESGIQATSLSFETSNNSAIGRIAQMFGQSIDASKSAEDILARRFWGQKEQFSSDVRRDIASAHDSALTEQFGGVWSGGRRGTFQLDAQSFIHAQPDLIESHLARMWALKRQGEAEDSPLRERARYDFAAALSRRLRNEADATSLQTAGDTDRQKGVVYDNNCPTGPTQTASQSLERLGLKREWKHGSCVNCHDVYNPGKIVGECSVCLYCEQADNMGKLKEVHHKARQIKQTAKQKSQARQATPEQSFETKKRKIQAQDIVASFGEKAILRTVYLLGGADKIVFDRESGEVLAKL